MGIAGTVFILIAISIHEFAHAWVADRLGDPTPRLDGRLTLNPLAHLDPIGTLALLLIGFGWGKPVAIDPYNLRRPRRDQALIALAGPASNLLATLAATAIYHLFPNSQFFHLIFTFAAINLSLALFNLLPLAPLDGSKIILGFLPPEKAIEWEAFVASYSLPLLLLALLPLFGPSLINRLLGPLISFCLDLLF